MVFGWLHKFHDPVQIERYSIRGDFCSHSTIEELGGSELREYIMLLEKFTTEPSLFFNVDGTLKRKAELCATLDVVARKRLRNSWMKYFTKFAILPSALLGMASMGSIFALASGIGFVAIGASMPLNLYNVRVQKDVKRFETTKRRLERWDRGVRMQQLTGSATVDGDVDKQRVRAFRHSDFNILWVIKPGGSPRVACEDILKAQQYWTPERFKDLKSEFGGVNERRVKK
jgi:hypothetical protein